MQNTPVQSFRHILYTDLINIQDKKEANKNFHFQALQDLTDIW